MIHGNIDYFSVDMKSPKPLALILASVAILLVVSCKKEEIILVPGNQAPPDHTVENITIESYINRVYISLLGRKPIQAEFDAAFTPLRSSDLSKDSRRVFIDNLTSTSPYQNRLFDVGRSLYLNSIDTTSIREQRDLFNLLLTQPPYQSIWPQITIERDRLNEILAIPADFATGTLTMSEMHRRLVHNYIYDQINMGTQNFVVSMFENFLFRYPTSAELAEGTAMVDGFTSTFFLQQGQNKVDFIDIFLASGAYFEGQVRDIFLRTHFREPTAEEVSILAVEYANSKDYEGLMREVLSTDEFAGI